jgi:hypothetical protein
MRHFLLFCLAALTSGMAQANFVGIESEVLTESEYGTVYRVYATFDNPTDELVAIYALETAPIEVTCSTSFFQSAVGSPLATGSNPAFFSFFPDLEFDSWFTIGSENSNGTSDIQQVGMDEYFTAFEAGNGFTINSFIGGSFFLIPNVSSDAEAGDDLKVLIGQFTTDGEVGLCLNFQWDDAASNTSNDEGYCITFGGSTVSVPGCTDPTACNYDASAEMDNGSCEYEDALGDCGGDCTADADGDGICDDEDDCVGAIDECGVCNGDGAVYECGCSDIPAGDCDCDGNQLDVFGVCGGGCTADADADGVCDDIDDCVGAYDDCGVCNGDNSACAGCTDANACNYNADALTDDGSCEYPADFYNCDGCENDSDGDGICDELEVLGCTSPGADNYNAEATEDDFSCTYLGGMVLGLSYELVTADALGTGQATYRLYVNFPSDDVEVTAVYGTDSAPWEMVNTAADGFYNNPVGADFGGSVNPLFFGAFPELEYDSWFTIGAEPGDADGLNSAFDSALTSLADFNSGGDFIVNTFVGGSIFVVPGANTQGVPVNNRVLLGQFTTSGVTSALVNVQFRDADQVSHYAEGMNLTFPQQGVGCTDEAACNYDPDAVVNLGCVYAEEFYSCDGCINDTDGDGVCDELEVSGCTDSSACNYDATATDDNGSCSVNDECGVCGGSGIPAGDCDCNGNQLDVLGVCGGSCTADADADGVCDDVDDCVGAIDECGVCNGDGAVYECGCSDIPAGDCDCDGNQLDVLGVCGGGCTADLDADGICDDIDDCVGAYDNCGVCNGDDSSCTGCTDVDACNYNEDAIFEDGSCEYPAEFYNCDGCISDVDGDGVCDELEVLGCTSPGADNYNTDATEDDLSCTYLGGMVLGLSYELVSDDALGTGQSTYRLYVNFPSDDVEVTAVYGTDSAPWEMVNTAADGFYNNPVGADFGGSVNPLFFSAFPELEYDSWFTIGSAPGDDDGLNSAFDSALTSLADFNSGGDFIVNTFVGGSIFVVPGANTQGVPVNNRVLLGQFTTSGTTAALVNVQFRDADQVSHYAEGMSLTFPQQGVGCTDATACNYDPEAVINSGCTYPAEFYSCDGCINDEDGDGICDELEVSGCTDPSACNYDASATDDDGSCTSLDACGICGGDDSSCSGCTDADACNYDASAIVNDGSCQYPAMYLDCAGNCLNDSDGDSICDELEVPGCTDADADNYNSDATDEDGSCEYLGCTDAEACNYDEGANVNDGSCDYPAMYLDCEGGCLNDSDGDAVCDELEVPGCTDAEADNYNADATDEDGSCEYLGCTNPAADNYDEGANVDDGSCVIAGCTNPDADNYNPDATEDDGSCEAVGCTYLGADNYDAINTSDDGSCVFTGCTDSAALNFIAHANNDDGSCVYEECTGESDCPFDANGDGEIGSSDLLEFLVAYGQACEDL